AFGGTVIVDEILERRLLELPLIIDNVGKRLALGVDIDRTRAEPRAHAEYGIGFNTAILAETGCYLNGKLWRVMVRIGKAQDLRIDGANRVIIGKKVMLHQALGHLTVLQLLPFRWREVDGEAKRQPDQILARFGRQRDLNELG